ncbi:MAG: helix-turn-helix domain-containing protein [Limisphaerales bacterium]
MQKQLRPAETAGAGTSKPAPLNTVSEVCALLRISRRSLQDRIRDGRIPCVRIGDRCLFIWEDVLRALRRRDGEAK